MSFDYPIYLALDDVAVLVVGGGRVAARKIDGLLAAGATVTAVAPWFSDEVLDMPIVRVTRSYIDSDLDGKRLVITATDDPAVNAQVTVDATARNIWANSADDPANCTFILPAIARNGALIAAVSTGGGSPALAGWLRSQIAREVLTESAVAALEQLAAERAAVQAAGGSTEDIDWQPRIRELLADDLLARKLHNTSSDATTTP
jgi:precorrin-2 dehydrogenase / sirohydrochlorin ferrochelatase